MIHTLKTYNLSVETVFRSPSHCYSKLNINALEHTLLANNLFFICLHISVQIGLEWHPLTFLVFIFLDSILKMGNSNYIKY